ncbi:glycosyltransferase [Parafrankia discariae]|uniref:glycosyltransferase n=1 Tax=Parafrankia discariae TaxID=365528 RepID=UPI000371A054|nr:glycosyltransferase [Parafrankia discariae]
MDVLFASLPAYGHLYPLVPLAVACQEAGHRVRLATGEPFLGALPVPTVQGTPADWTLRYVEEETARRHPDATGVEFPVAMFADVAAEGVLGVLEPLFAADPPDVVVADSANLGAVIAASLAGVPAVVFGVGQWSPFGEMTFPAALAAHRSRWTAAGRAAPAGPGEMIVAYLEPFPPDLRHGPGPDGVPVLPIRSTAWADAQAPVPGWLTAPAERPRVYVTLGTVSFGAVEVIRAVVDDLAALDVDVLVAAGPEGDPAALGPLPERVRVERFVAQSRVLGLVDVAVHHGGSGTVLGALANGVPQVLLPQGADHFHNAWLLAERGAARVFHNETRQPGDVAAAVRDLLGDAPERRATALLAAQIAASPTPTEAVAAIAAVAAAATGTPVMTVPGD